MKKTVGFLLIIFVIAISFAAIFVKWSEAPATILSMYRMYLASILLLPMIYVNRKEFSKISKKEWLILLAAGVFLALHFALWFESLTTVASSTIILSLQPIVALLGGFLICKERTTISTLIAIVISIIGVVMVGWGDFGLNRQSVIIGDIFKCFGNCLLFINWTKYGKADFSLDLQFFCSYFNDLNLFAKFTHQRL